MTDRVIPDRGLICAVCGATLKIFGESDRSWAKGHEVNWIERDRDEIETWLEKHQGHAITFDVLP